MHHKGQEGKTAWALGDLDGPCEFWDGVAPTLNKDILRALKDEPDANKVGEQGTLRSSLYDDVKRALLDFANS